MHILPTIFLLSLLSGSMIQIPLFFNITVYPHDIVLSVYLILWFLWGREKKKKIVFFSLGKPIGAFVGILLVSYLIHVFGHSLGECIIAFSYIIRMVLYLGLYVVISNTKDPFFWLKRLYGTGVIFSILGIIQYILYPNLRNLAYLGWDPHYYRLFSTFLDPNFAGLFLIVTFLLGVYYLAKLGNDITIFVLQAIILSALTLTLSRSTYLSFIGVVLLYVWLKKTWRILIGVIVFIGILFWLPFPQKNVTPILRIDSSSARITNWSESISLIKQAPVFGHGFNFLRSVQKTDMREIDSSKISHAGAGVDNSFLFVLATTGIFGGIIWIYLLFSMWRIGRRMMKIKKEQTLGIIYCLSLLAILIHSMFVNSFFYPWILVWLWILTGVAERTLGSKTEKYFHQ